MSVREKRTGNWEANKGVNAVLCFAESVLVQSTEDELTQTLEGSAIKSRLQMQNLEGSTLISDF